MYKITYPNGKIYVGMDLTGSLLYLGSPNAHKRIAADLELDPRRFDLTLRKEILWECETASDAEVRKKELELIRETGANNPEIGYNVLPRWGGPMSAASPPRRTSVVRHPRRLGRGACRYGSPFGPSALVTEVLTALPSVWSSQRSPASAT